MKTVTGFVFVRGVWDGAGGWCVPAGLVLIFKEELYSMEIVIL